VNKAQLIEALAERLGDKKTASQAVEGVVDLIVRNVNKGEKVNITGFGVFEKRARAARTARNPRTGETVKVKKTNVPAFRAGTQFKEVVGGTRKLPRATAKTSASKGTTARATAKPSTTRAGKSGTATARTAAARATTARSTAKTSSTAKSTASKTSGRKASTAKTTRPATQKSTATRRGTKK
jgi:DNA-binding protein HU-beta